MPEATSGKGPQFALVPHDLAKDTAHGANDVALYTVLKSHADFGKGSEEAYVGGAFPGSHTLADMVGISRPAVRSARDRLEEAGWLSYFERPGKSHIYFLHHEPLTEDERDFWTQETLELRKAWREGGADALFTLLEDRS